MEPEAEIIRTQLFALRDETYRTFNSSRAQRRQRCFYRPCRMDTTKRTTSTRF